VCRSLSVCLGILADSDPHRAQLHRGTSTYQLLERRTVFCAMFAHGRLTSFPYFIANSRQIGPILVLCRGRLLGSFFGDLRFFLFLGADMLVSLLFS